jgi:glycosyltransferase involved in cell wall biosynthesis
VGFGSPLFQIVNLIKLFRKNQVDLIHVNGSRACFYAGWAGRILRVPVVWHVRESEPDFFLYDAVLGLLANVIICVSKSVKLKRFSRFGQAMLQKIAVVYNGVDTIKFQARNGFRKHVRRQLGVQANDIFFGLVGNLIPRKAQHFFLKGLASAREINPGFSAKTVIIGRDVDLNYTQTLHRLVSELNLHDCVMFQDFSENIIDMLSALDIFVLSSKSEGFSRSLLEAMSVGLPVLATRIDEIQEAVSDGQNALLADYNDVNTMAAAILKLAEDKQLREKMGKANRKKVVQIFDLASHTKAVQNIYTGLSIQK